MNREIKFRVWDNAGKQYLSLQDYQDLGAIEIENDGTLTLSPRFRFLTSMMIMPERFVPQQYVGLKDKNGVEIYEGDIILLDCYDYEEPAFDGEFKVVYDEIYGMWLFIDLEDEKRVCIFEDIRDCYKSDIKVIGNIYENEVD